MAAKLQFTKKEIMEMIKRRHQTRPKGPFDQPKNILRLKKWQEFALQEWLEIGKRLFECPEIETYFKYTPKHEGKRAWIEE